MKRIVRMNPFRRSTVKISSSSFTNVARDSNTYNGDMYNTISIQQSREGNRLGSRYSKIFLTLIMNTRYPQANDL